MFDDAVVVENELISNNISVLSEMKTKDLVQDEALNAISKHRNAGIGITVGGGKTLLGLLIILLSVL